MIRTYKILSFLFGCLGAALLLVALLAMPPNAIQADNPSGGSGPNPLSLCWLVGNPADSCIVRPDPCYVIFENCVNVTGGCGCK